MGYKPTFSILLIVSLLLGIDSIVRVIIARTILDQNWNKNTLQVVLSSTHNVQSEIREEVKNTVSIEHVNPHWDKTKCHTCHDNTTSSKANILKASESEGLCSNCHEDDTSHIYIHPTGIKVPNSRKAKISKNWAGKPRLDKSDRLTCQSCHDLLDQCLPGRSHQVKLNPSFLRGGPYPNRYTLCYRCHDSKKYERNNPHDQIADNGLLKVKMCRLCHEVEVNKNIKHGIEKNLRKYPLLKDMNEDRTLLCVRCHRKIDHPSSSLRVSSNKKYRHLVKIDNNKKSTLEKQNIETGIVLPLEPYTGRIYCGTCHQPHQAGVFKGETLEPVTMKNHRLRSKPICKHCHDIYGSYIDIEKK
jgi:predicted CXXCH cytochrome family protein